MVYGRIATGCQWYRYTADSLFGSDLYIDSIVNSVYLEQGFTKVEAIATKSKADVNATRYITKIHHEGHYTRVRALFDADK